MEPLIEHSTTAAGFRTRVLELEGGGPGLVLLHGWGDSAGTWRPLLALLGERERRAIAVDLPGYGHADRAVDGPVLPQLDAFARDLAASRRSRARCCSSWGTRDRMVPHTGARVLLEALEGVEVALLDGVGQCPQLEATDRLAELLLRFMISLDDPDTG